MKVSYIIKKRIKDEIEINEEFIRQALNEDVDVDNDDTAIDIMKDADDYIRVISEKLIFIRELKQQLKELETYSEI